MPREARRGVLPWSELTALTAHAKQLYKDQVEDEDEEEHQAVEKHYEDKGLGGHFMPCPLMLSRLPPTP